MNAYTLAELIGDLRSAYGARAAHEAIALMIEAKRHGLQQERDVFTRAAIMLCEPEPGRLLS